jgi:hypothetical protein
MFTILARRTLAGWEVSIDKQDKGCEVASPIARLGPYRSKPTKAQFAKWQQKFCGGQKTQVMIDG